MGHWKNRCATHGAGGWTFGPDYLRMPDVLRRFLQASGVGLDVETDGRTTAHAPWDLLIVDECHHFAPQSGGRASQRTHLLREIRFLFEYRLFICIGRPWKAPQVHPSVRLLPPVTTSQPVFRQLTFWAEEE